jgi:hypothetical protein
MPVRNKFCACKFPYIFWQSFAGLIVLPKQYNHNNFDEFIMYKLQLNRFESFRRFENLQKYRYILGNIDRVFRDFSWFVPNFALHINNIDWEDFWLFTDLFRRLVYFIKEYLATPWRVAVKYCHFWAFSCLASSSYESPGNEVGYLSLFCYIPVQLLLVPSRAYPLSHTHL